MKTEGQRTRRYAWVLIVVILAIWPCRPAEGSIRTKRQPPAKAHGVPRGIFGVTYGMLGTADLTLEDKAAPFSKTIYSNDGGSSIGIFLDFPVYRGAAVGISADAVGLKFGVVDASGLDLSLLLKYSFLARNGKAAIRPCAGIGYALASNVQGLSGQVENTTTRFYLEGIYFLANGFGITGQIGQYRLISGGSLDYKISSSAFTYFRFGLVFGRLK
jgi:hypothetical protein